jgi:predicted secreted protein
MPWPVPRAWAVPGLVLVAVQTMALRSMHDQGEVLVGPDATTPARVDTFAEAVGIFVVPAATAALFAVVLWHLARANAGVRRRAKARRGAQAMGSDIPTG